MADESSKCPDREFFVLGDAKVGANARLDHHHMASDLTRDRQPAFSKALTASFPEMLASLPMRVTGPPQFAAGPGRV